MAWRFNKRGAIVSDGPEGEPGTFSDAMNRAHYDGNLVAESIRSETNGHVMAAAPELLAVAKALRGMGHVRRAGNVYRTLVAAIAKAEGRA